MDSQGDPGEPLDEQGDVFPEIIPAESDEGVA